MAGFDPSDPRRPPTAEAWEPTWESVGRHVAPDWFGDAKLGVFLHWGLYSVPAWAPPVPDIQTILREHDPAWLLRNSPYAEWYANTMLLAGSPTQIHHARTYGADAGYDSFVEPFDEGSATADLDALADLCRRSGAGYVVLTAKHHDGFCLWPSSERHPVKGRYHARRDLVGDLTEAVRAAGLRMGLYYSGGFDWPFNGAVVAGVADLVLAVPQSQAYAAYCDAHLRELIDRYQPSVLWNDIAAPGALDLPALFAHYYSTVPDGVVNNRWSQGRPAGRVLTAVIRAAGAAVQGAWRVLPGSWKELRSPRVRHADFTTPEYAHPSEIIAEKWESTRGVGHSFGANRAERLEDVITTTELVRSFVDIVAKNGNLLIGVGPEPDGTVPEWQAAPLLGLGEWLAVNREAVVGSRPWLVAEGRTAEGGDVRFVRRGGQLYAVLLESPPTRRVRLQGVEASSLTDVGILGVEGAPEWEVVNGGLTVHVPERLPPTPALALRLGPESELRPTDPPQSSSVGKCSTIASEPG